MIQKMHGRMKVMGVKPAAPMRPIRSAKNGRQMATKVVSATYRLRTTARISRGLLEGHRCLSVKKVSTFSKTGCAKICSTHLHQLREQTCKVNNALHKSES